MRLDLTLKPIGHIKTPFKQKFGTPRQSGLVPAAAGEIYLNKEFVPSGSLEGLRDFSHLWLLFHFHQNTNETVSGKVKPPRLKGEKMGLFATRSPHRPNPVGMSLVKIADVDEDNLVIKVKGVDLTDGTPIFDIKPYIPSYDIQQKATSGWTQFADDKVYEVKWSQQALKDAQTHQLTDKDIELINQVFSRDIRNQSDMKESAKVYKVLILKWDVTVSQVDHCEILAIQQSLPPTKIKQQEKNK